MIEDQLKEAARQIVHCGDYGHLWWNEKEGKVHWTAGDADFDDGYTSYEDVEKLFTIPGVRSIEIGDEWDPADLDGEDGWKLLIGPSYFLAPRY